MNRLLNIFLISIFTLALSGCDGASSDTNIDQRDDITDWLESSHSPKLIALSEVEDSLDDDPEFYTTTGATTFMYIENFYDADRESLPQVAKGSEISIVYTLYNFEDITAPSLSDVLLTNDPEVIELLEADGLNATYWSSEVLTFKVGSGALFGGVETLLVGCHEGDILEFYMTYNDAYGSSMIGTSTEEMPLALYCTINEVNN